MTSEATSSPIVPPQANIFLGALGLDGVCAEVCRECPVMCQGQEKQAPDNAAFCLGCTVERPAPQREFARQAQVEGQASVCYYRALDYAKKGKLDRAIAGFGKAIELDPKFAFAYNARAWTYL